MSDTRKVTCHTPDCVSEGVEYEIPNDDSMVVCGGCFNFLVEDEDV